MDYLISLIITGLILYPLYNKIDHDEAWWAFIPILNILFIIKHIGRNLLEILFLLIPIVNLIFFIIWSLELLRRLGRSGIEVILLFIPFVNLIYILYLGLSSDVRYR